MSEVADAVIRAVNGRALPIPGNDIDTDRIMPARYLKCVTFADLGQYLFQDERLDPRGQSRNHPVDDPRHRGARLMIVNKNFGCGSSREHAPQGIRRWGIQAVIGESFAEIFAGNCAAIGLVAATAAEDDVRALMTFAAEHPDREIRLDLEDQTVTAGETVTPVRINEAARRGFLNGSWDTTATLLAAGDAIEAAIGRLPALRQSGLKGL